MTHKIDPKTIYANEDLPGLFGFDPQQLALGRQNGTLEWSRVSKRILYRGEWLIRWLENDQRTTLPSKRAPGSRGPVCGSTSLKRPTPKRKPPSRPFGLPIHGTE